MPRPTLIVAEPEPSEALSIRKLVLETAKFNVLKAHSTQEAIDIFKQFPVISTAVLVGGDHIDCETVASTIKHARKVPVIYLHAHIGGRCPNADHALSSHEPEKLVDLLRSLLGDPRKLENEAA